MLKFPKVNVIRREETMEHHIRLNSKSASVPNKIDSLLFLVKSFLKNIVICLHSSIHHIVQVLKTYFCYLHNSHYYI